MNEFTEGVFKLHADGDIMGRVLKNADMKINAGRMSATVILTTADEDRSGDIVFPKGIDLSDHKKNPIALLNHDRNAPIGRFEDKLGNYTVKMRGDQQLVGEVFFNQSSEFAHDVFRAVENKIFTGVSVGFMPKRVEKRNPRGNLYHSSSLVEGSILTLGDNPNAIVEAVNKSLLGGKPYSEQLLAILRPLVSAKNETVVGGFDANVTIEGGASTDAVEKGMYGEQDDTLLGGGQDDTMIDDGMGGDDQQQQAGADTEQAWLTIAIDLVQQAMAHDESALKKLGMLLKTRKKLIVGGDDGDIMDMAQDEPEEGDEDEVDFETPDDDDEDNDGETDAPGPQGKKKKKQSVVLDKGYVWRERDCDAITYVYKTLTSIACTPFLDREKMDPFVYEAIKQLEAITPIERGIVEKKIKTPHKTRPAAVAAQHEEEDLTAILLALDESDAEREARCRQRDRKLFSIFGR